MSPGNLRVRSRRIRAVAVAGALGIAMIACALGATAPASATPARPAASPSPTASATPSAAPRPVGSALAFDLAARTVLTLPAGDGLRDTTAVHVRSGRPGSVDIDAIRGSTTIRLATDLALRATSTGWSRGITVRVAGLGAGTWRLRAERSSAPAVQARSRPFQVGTGGPVHVFVRPAARTLYPYADHVLDSAAVTVVATDETGAELPIRGTIRIDAGRKHVTRTLTTAGTATLPITALPLGTATLRASVTGPAGKAVRTTGLTLAPTGVGGLRIARSSDTVQPVIDGLLDSVVLTTSGTASAGSPAKVSGTLTIAKGATVAARFRVPDGAEHAFTWNGRVKGVVEAGTYTVALSLKGPQGPVRTTTRTLAVTKAHLPYAVRDLFTVAAGNQQGLAVRNGFFYVGYDIGNAQSEIQRYDGTGLHVGTLGPLPIEHVAELAYSTTTDLLYAANGGAHTLTKVYAIDPVWDPSAPPADPATSIQQRFDLSALGYNGMVAVDDVKKRLLVFSSSAPSSGYMVSSVTLTPSTITNADGTTQTIPAGTVTASVPVTIDGVPQGMDLVGQQLWIYTSLKKVNHVAKYDLATNALLSASSARSGSDLYWGGEGEGMATVAASDTNDGLPAWIYVGAHSTNRIGELVPVTDQG